MNRRAFTLIEVMIVVIIAGVLASIGLRNYLDAVERMRGAEPREILMRGYAAYQRILMEEEPIGGPNQLTWIRLGMPDVNANGASFFTYSIEPSGAAPTGLRAVRKNDNSRRLEVVLATGVLTKTAPY